MRSKVLENTALVASQRIRSALDIKEDPKVGIVLGTGWGDVLDLKDSREFPMREISDIFEALPALEGHRRQVCYGLLDRTPVVALRGRVHMNESHHPDHWKMVRLQIEMLIQLGVKTLVLTCAAGSLDRNLRVGDVLLIDGFVSAFVPRWPLLGGEFRSPEDAIDRKLLSAAFTMFIPPDPKSIDKGGYAYMIGPAFEGRKYDKALLAAAGAKAVGMSVVPEAAVAALYAEEGVGVLPLAFITNSATEDHSHEENVRRAKERSAALAEYLTRVIAKIPSAR